MPHLMSLPRIRWLVLAAGLSRAPPDEDLISVLLAMLDDASPRMRN